jgi:hypothetical protein
MDDLCMVVPTVKHGGGGVMVPTVKHGGVMVCGSHREAWRCDGVWFPP